MDQSQKSLKDGLRPKQVYEIAPKLKEDHPKKVVFAPPTSLREEADAKALRRLEEAYSKHSINKKT